MAVDAKSSIILVEVVMFLTIAQAIGASRSLNAQPMRSLVSMSVEGFIPFNARAKGVFQQEVRHAAPQV
jgi:hypothetical protein